MHETPTDPGLIVFGFLSLNRLRRTEPDSPSRLLVDDDPRVSMFIRGTGYIEQSWREL